MDTDDCDRKETESRRVPSVPSEDKSSTTDRDKVTTADDKKPKTGTDSTEVKQEKDDVTENGAKKEDKPLENGISDSDKEVESDVRFLSNHI